MDFALRANGFIHQRDQLLDSSIGDIERMQSKATYPVKHWIVRLLVELFIQL
jgi:hypothetical protein